MHFYMLLNRIEPYIFNVSLPLMHAISLSILFDAVPSLIILKFVRSYRGNFQDFMSEFHVVAFINIAEKERNNNKNKID